MERRYGRANYKYRAKIEKKKIPLEKRLARQSAVCAIILAVGAALAFMPAETEINEPVRAALYNTNSPSDWKNQFEPAAKKIKTGAFRAVAAWDGAVKICEKRLGLTKPQTSQPVKADTKKKSGANKEKETIKSEKTENLQQNDNEKQPSAEPTFCVPAQGEISSVFGTRTHPISGETLEHTGIDIAAPDGQCVVAAAPGIVERIGEDSANGKYAVVRHSENCTTVYAHLSKLCVEKGESVDESIRIGEVGSSGISTGPHLHFEIKIDQKSVNPENYISLPHRKGV